jgi:hypothetical protein
MRHLNTKIIPGILLALGLTSCSHPAPVVVMAPPPPPPVGHTYQVLVQVPAPAPTRRVRITPAMQEQVQQAFNVIGLKSALMVAALSCGQQDQYDAFMTEFQPHILAEQHVMDQYFRRIGGYQGRAEEDDFVTLLANNQSVSGLGQGQVFCLNNSAEFKEVLALNSPSQLDSLVTDQSPDPQVEVAAANPPAAPYVPVHLATLHHRRHLYLAAAHSAKPLHPATGTASATPAKPLSMAAATSP